MTPPLAPHFDPSNPDHRTVAEWARAGRFSWFRNAMVHTMQSGEVRVLLRAGAVLRLFLAADGGLDLEEL
jgi:hypothetical protein